MHVWIDGVAVLAPGLPGWEHGRKVLAGEHPYVYADQADPELTLLPPNESRRSSRIVRWALHVAEQAVFDAQVKPGDVTTVFASSGGETAIWHQLCTALASPERLVSPTLFHHSVHNAVAGYWTIGTGTNQASSSLAGYDASFCAGLLEAATLVTVERKAVLLVVYDLPAPEPIHTARPLSAGFSTGLILTGRGSPSSHAEMMLSVVSEPGIDDTTMIQPGLERLRMGNPAARALPLLAALAGNERAHVRLAYLDDQQVLIDVNPCRSCRSAS